VNDRKQITGQPWWWLRWCMVLLVYRLMAVLDRYLGTTELQIPPSPVRLI